VSARQDAVQVLRERAARLRREGHPAQAAEADDAADVLMRASDEAYMAAKVEVDHEPPVKWLLRRSNRVSRPTTPPGTPLVARTGGGWGVALVLAAVAGGGLLIARRT